jgi:hypothetical protein
MSLFVGIELVSLFLFLTTLFAFFLIAYKNYSHQESKFYSIDILNTRFTLLLPGIAYFFLKYVDSK